MEILGGTGKRGIASSRKVRRPINAWGCRGSNGGTSSAGLSEAPTACPVPESGGPAASAPGRP